MSRSARIVRTVLHYRIFIMIMCLMLAVFGAYFFHKLPVDAYPNIAPLNIQVITQWLGRSTLEIERQLTIPIETALSGVPDIHSLRSVSLFGLSSVTLQFEEGTDSFHARTNVQMYLSGANLPAGVVPALSPDADALGEILRYRLEGDNYDLLTLKSWQDWDIFRNLISVPGVADINGFGGMVKQYQVLPSPEKMHSYGITLSQLDTALSNANTNVGGDVINGGEQRYVVRGVGLLQSLDDIRNVVIAVNQGVPVRVSDIAQVRMGNAPRLGMVKFNRNNDAVEGIVVMRRGGNASEVLARVRKKIADLNTSGILPKGLKIAPFYDRQNLLDMTLGTVKHTLLMGIILVLIVLYLFLGNIRASIATAMVIPLSLFVALTGMYFFNIPANLISLGAIDFGLIVEAAVIVIENIMRHLETNTEGLHQTIVEAAAEVQRAMVFSTLIIITSYLPLFIMGGIEGKIFQPMAFTMGLGLLASIILSVTFIPVSASYLFNSGITPHTPEIVGWILGYYRPLLEKLIRKPVAVIAVALVALAVALFGAFNIGTDFLPTLEENNLWIRVTLPNTVDLDYSSKIAGEIRNYFLSQPEIETVVVQIGRPDDGTDSTGVFNLEFGVYLKKPGRWPRGASKVLLEKKLQAYLEGIPGIEYEFSQYIQDNVSEAISGVKGENSVKLFGSDLGELNKKALKIETLLKKIRGIEDVGIYQELGQPTLNISVNRSACARFAINVSDVVTLVQNAIGGNAVSSILEGERTFDLAVRFPETSRDMPEKVKYLLVDTPDGQRIPLSMLADVELTDGPFFIYREAGKRYIAIKFGVRDRDLGSAAAEAQKVIKKEIELPRGYTIKWDGEFNQMKTAQLKLAVIIPLTLFVIFLLLFFTFGNVLESSIVILNVPFAAIGGIAALYIAGENLSISAGIGFLSLFGIAIQNGIILIANVKKLSAHKGYNLEAAVIEGSALRLRPVVMIALLAGLGLLPAALSHAVGSQAQRPLALVIVGGMVSTTLLTLLVLPVIFAWVHKVRGLYHLNKK
ncbi:MAG: CusA/CzcA family heavy metal efflux RND transporter [Endomicrobiales bacterium]